MAFSTSLGALLGGATEEAGKIHQERYLQEQADRKFTFDTLTHILDDQNIGNPQVKEEALQELHGRLMQTMFPDQFTHKPGKLGKLVDQFVGMQRPQGPMGPMMTMGAGGNMPQPGVGTGNARQQVGTSLPPPPQGAQPSVAGSSGVPPQGQSTLGSMLPPSQMFGPEDITASGIMSPAAGAYKKAYDQAQMDKVKFQQDYQTKLETWKWLEANDPILQKMSPEEKNLEHARFMYNMTTPVSYLKGEEAKDQITYGQMADEAAANGLPLPPGAKPGMAFRRVQNLGHTIRYETAEPLAPIKTGVITDPTSSTGY